MTTPNEPRPLLDPTNDDALNQVARVAYEANRALQQVLGEKQVSPVWEQASDEQRTSTREGIQRVLDGAGAEQLHEAWCQSKLDRGWQYGHVKDEQARTHPCLVTYDQLPAGQRAKDHLIRAVVTTLTQQPL